MCQIGARASPARDMLPHVALARPGNVRERREHLNNWHQPLTQYLYQQLRIMKYI